MNWAMLYNEVMTDRRLLLALMAEAYRAAALERRDDVAFNLTVNGYSAAGLFYSLDGWGVQVTREAVALVEELSQVPHARLSL